MRTIEGFAQYLLTETDKVITKEGEIEVPITDNKVTIKNDAGKEKTVSIGFLIEMSEPIAKEGEAEEAPVKETPEPTVDKEAEKVDKAAEKEAKATEKAKKATAKEEKAAAKKAKAAEPKAPGIIASIFEFIKDAKPGKNGITHEQILEKLVKRFPDRADTSMASTIKANLGTKRPCYSEKKHDVTFDVVEVTTGKGETTKVAKHYSVKA